MRGNEHAETVVYTRNSEIDRKASVFCEDDVPCRAVDVLIIVTWPVTAARACGGGSGVLIKSAVFGPEGTDHDHGRSGRLGRCRRIGGDGRQQVTTHTEPACMLTVRVPRCQNSLRDGSLRPPTPPPPAALHRPSAALRRNTGYTASKRLPPRVGRQKKPNAESPSGRNWSFLMETDRIIRALVIAPPCACACACGLCNKIKYHDRPFSHKHGSHECIPLA
ncbi:hypothetical protein EVAR_19521_1 [Eumeta japonica]|uniref:Uncharacterized protein n=1 Tax=Eumeta variegata TaxID=151549 RepID=A0A4C1UF04_EUMVA|nr:hypothetical protein EVAR_19521_1 [Eumeta japonica]